MNIILLEACGQLFGIDADRVVQVVEPPQVTAVPFLPDHVEGLVNVGGSVVVSVDLARALGGEASTVQGVSVVVRAEVGAFVLRVGRVLMMVPVAEADLHPVAEGAPALGHGVVAGEFSWQDRMVLLIDPDRFDLGEVPADAGQAGSTDFATLAGAVVEASATKGGDVVPWLLVDVGGERYALDVRGVTEVVEAEGFLPVPKAPPAVMGYHSLRGGPLLVASLARLLDLPPSPVHHVVVVDQGAGRLGLGVGRVLGIRGFDARAADDVADASGAVAGCLVDGDGSMLAILDLGHVLTPQAMAGLSEYMPRNESGHAAAKQAGGSRRLLTFWLGDELCGIDLEAVARVAECHGWTDLPADSGLQLSGVTQIGNEVMPMVDLRRRRGQRAENAPAAQVVARIDGGNCALAVDRMHRIIDLPLDDIRAVDEGDDLVSAVGRADDRLISLLTVDHLVEGRA